MQIIICEKPKVAARVAEALAEGPVRQQRLRGLSYYEIKRNGKELLVLPVVGHVYGLKQKDDTRGYPVFDIEWAPAYEAEKGAAYTKAYVENIRDLSKKADEFVSACDYDIEGSLIGFNAIRFACRSEKGKRMKFSALTKSDLVEAYESMAELDFLNAYAGEARHTLDWYYGINLSRALMGAIRSKGQYQVMSIGRVQGPALAVLAEKENAIGKFVPVPYWQLFVRIKEVQFEHTHGRFAKREEAEKAKANTGKTGRVIKLERKKFTQPPNPPFDLTSLQIEAYHLFKFSPSATLAMAQSLYESSLISYPRTSSQKLPAKLNLPNVIYGLQKREEYKPLCDKLINEKRFQPFEGKKEDPAHPAIHPTGQMGNPSPQEKKLYDLIVRRFLACFAAWAERERQTVEVKSNTETYIAQGSRTLSPGWFEFYAPYLKLQEVTLPPFARDEEVKLEKLQLVEKMTQPPKRYSPSSLIAYLESKNLGTKATRSVILDTLFKRGYAEGTQIKVTPFGMAVYHALRENCPEILDEELTRGIENEMEQIQEGKLDKEKVVGDGRKILEKILAEFKENEEKIALDLVAGLRQKEFVQSALGKCPKCGGELRSRRSKLNKQFVGCANYPKCSQTYPLPQNALIEPNGKVCEKCDTPIVKVVRKGKRPFEMCLDPNCVTKANWGKPKPPAASGPTTTKTALPTTAKPPLGSPLVKPGVKPAAKPPSTVAPSTSIFVVPEKTAAPALISTAPASISLTFSSEKKLFPPPIVRVGKKPAAAATTPKEKPAKKELKPKTKTAKPVGEKPKKAGK